MRVFIFAILLLPLACETFPELDGQASEAARTAAMPRIGPLEPILDGRGNSNLPTAEEDEELLKRAERLRAKANAMRGAVVSDETRARIVAAQKEVAERQAEADALP